MKKTCSATPVSAWFCSLTPVCSSACAWLGLGLGLGSGSGSGTGSETGIRARVRLGLVYSSACACSRSLAPVCRRKGICSSTREMPLRSASANISSASWIESATW